MRPTGLFFGRMAASYRGINDVGLVLGYDLGVCVFDLMVSDLRLIWANTSNM